MALRAATAITVLLILCQEVSPSSGVGARAPAAAFGSGLYYLAVGHIPLIEYVLVLGAILALIGAQARNSSRFPFAVVLILAGGAIIGISSIRYGLSLKTTVSLQMRPYVLAASSLIVGYNLPRQEAGARSFTNAVGITLGFVSMIGVYLYLSHQGISIGGGTQFIFYDSALPALAAGVLLAILFSVDKSRIRYLIAIACMIILFFSFRRNVWLATIVGFLVGAVTQRARLELLGRFAGFAILGTVTSLLAAPHLVGAIWQRAVDGVGALGGAQVDVSSSEHISDLRYAWMYAKENPIEGVGPTHDPLPGLSVQSGYLYVHNTFLMDWLRYGLPGLLVVSGLSLAGWVLALHSLRRANLGLGEAAAAFFLLVAPICALSAAFFTTTQRWPALLGLAAGLLLSRRVGKATELAARGAEPHEKTGEGEATWAGFRR